MEYLLHILIIMVIYIVLAISLDLLAGQMGCLSIAHAAFYGIGAYTTALLTVRWGFGFMPGLAAGVIFASLVSFALSLPSLRLRDDYFVIATFSFQMILYSILNNWLNLTRGPLGIHGIPQPIIFGWHVTSNLDFLGIAIFLLILAYLIVHRLLSSPYGRVLHAIREDELFAKSLGKNVLRFKLQVFAISAALAASAGGLYAHYISYIDPTSFTVMESILVISMVIIGGAGSRWGPLVGAVVLVSFPEFLRLLGLSGSMAANIRQILYGGLLVACMIWRPQGFLGEYSFRNRGDSK